MTYSLIARDPDTGGIGFGVQSHFFGVGRVVGHAEAGVGGILTQAFAEISFGPRGMALLRDGLAAEEVLAALLGPDERRETRQVAVIDAEGGIAVHTGTDTVLCRGHHVGAGVTAQGNMLGSDDTPEAMVAAFAQTDGPLADKLLAAMDRAEVIGGDLRGRQSAALYVVDGVRSDAPWDHVLVDVRVDDHPEPLVELRRLAGLNGFYDRLLQMMSEPRLLGGPEPPTAEQAEVALAELSAGMELLGDNHEATLWRGVVLARIGRDAEAAAHLAAAIELQPELDAYIRGFPTSGVLSAEQLARVLPVG